MSLDSRDRAIDDSKLRIGVSHIPVASSLIEFSTNADGDELDSEVYAQLSSLSEEVETVKQSLETRQRVFRRQRQILDIDVKRALDTGKRARPLPRRHDKSNQKNAQKSTRHDRTHSNHANFNIWQRVEAFFRPVPTDAEIESIFSDRLANSTVPDLPNGIHWSQRFATLVQKSQGRALPPPGPSMGSAEISSFWRNEPPPFQLEKMQLRNESVFHSLLSAFVEAEPEKTEENGENHEDSVEDSSEGGHVLLPFVEFDPYLSHGFETRLKLELESAGLDKCSEKVETPHNAFDIEIRELQDQVETELRPELDRLKQRLMKLMPAIRAKQAKMADEAAIYRAMIAELNPKKRKR